MTVKRFFLLCLLALFGVWICRPFCVNEEILFSFDAKVSAKTKFDVLAFGKNVREFEASRSLDPDTAFRTISYVVPVRKLTGINLSITGNDTDFEIKNVVLDGKNKLIFPSKDIRVFFENIASYSENGATISGQANKNAVLLFFLNKTQKGKIHFVFPAFFTLSVLWFLFFDRLLSFLLRKFPKISETLKSHPYKSDYVFLAIFFAFLIYPVSDIDFSSSVSRENRRLAPAAKIFLNGRINVSFGRQFDEWFKDRFAGRNKIIDLYNSFQNTFNKHFERHGVIIGKNGWMFHGRLSNFKGTDAFSEAELQKIKDNLIRLQNFCDKHGIKLYIAVSPYKHHIYPEFYPEEVKRPNDVDREDRLEQFLIRELPDTKFVYFKKALLDEKEKSKDWLYFKTDHHWTDKGAYTGYRALMELIEKDFPSVKPVSLSEYVRTTGRKVRAECDRNFNEGTQYLSLAYHDESLFDLDYVFYDHKHLSDLKIDDQCKAQSFARNDKAAPYKVFYITDSQGENFMEFLGHTFRDIQKRRYNAEIKERRKNENIYMPFYENDILKYRPDILILQVYDAYVPSLKSLYED
ncbi:putative uncharacterized protein [Acetobacter sp. CAG:977]|nr:putative uncharacterized protein [Acetobacter sp. CAG:977]